MNDTITMPTLSDTMQTGQLVRWVKAPGDKLKSGDTVAEVETDKALMEVEVFHDGYLAGPLAAVDTDLPVGQVIGYISDSPDVSEPSPALKADPKAKPGSKPEAEAKSEAEAKLKAKPETEPETEAQSKPKAEPETPVVTAMTDLLAVAASVPDLVAEQPPAEPARAAQPAAPEKSVDATVSSQPSASHPDSSPLARRMAEAADIVLSTLHGTGPHGRIVAADVTRAELSVKTETLAETLAKTLAKTNSQTSPGLTDSQILAMYPEGSYTLKAHSGMRRMIAKRLVQASIGTPHFDLTVECDIGKLLDARHTMNGTAPMGKNTEPLWKVTVTDYIVKALASALQKVPEANATWTAGGMLTFERSDIGVAVAIKGGLMVPLIRSADTKSLSDIAIEVLALATRAKERKLTAADYEGGGSTVSNLGMNGIRNFSAVLNPPQATILAIGAGEERVVVRNKKVTQAMMMSVTLTCDHRVVDGVLGAQLLAAFKALIEQPDTLAK